MSVFQATFLSSQKSYGVDLGESDLIPNKQEVFNHLKIWVFGTYRLSPQKELAKKYLDKCLTRMNEQGLRGKTQDLIKHNKCLIKHALERDELIKEISILRFEQKTLEKIEISRQRGEIQRQQKEESTLEETLNTLRWENHVMKAVRLGRSKRMLPIAEKSRMQIQTDDKIAAGKLTIQQLEQVRERLIRDIRAEENDAHEKKEELRRLEKKVNKGFIQTPIKEEELKLHRISCLEEMDEFQKEIDRYIDKMESEPKRLQLDLKIHDDEFIKKMCEISDDFRRKLSVALEEQAIARRFQDEEWIAKINSEDHDFGAKFTQKQESYNRLDNENYAVFQDKNTEFRRRLDKEVILNKSHFIAGWNSVVESWNESQSINHQRDVNPALREIIQKRNKAIELQKSNKTKDVNDRSKRTDSQFEEERSKFHEEFKKHMESVQEEKRNVENLRTTLNKEIQEKLKSLRGEEK